MPAWKIQPPNHHLTISMSCLTSLSLVQGNPAWGDFKLWPNADHVVSYLFSQRSTLRQMFNDCCQCDVSSIDVMCRALSAVSWIGVCQSFPPTLCDTNLRDSSGNVPDVLRLELRRPRIRISANVDKSTHRVDEIFFFPLHVHIRFVNRSQELIQQW
ncbi:hypothetical protein BGZ63DRAFT_214654 [Mariannaea sp. PMI_226]|nr:hypothetical protein BGZ63DRAFT_214654 [Mariannaea sp. PMI_226]